MKFKIIDTKTGLEPDYSEINNAEWYTKGIYRDKEGNILYKVAPMMKLEGFALTEDGEIIVYDRCSNYSYPPEGKFEIEWL